VSEYTTIWRVYVLKPLKRRERKHALAIFRVGAADETEAKAKVQGERLDDDAPGSGERIVGCTRFGDAGAVIYDGALMLTPAEIAHRFPGA
jgi:hypothetical protein